jgi:uncharacterized protein involved in exopolysaccharide biosynthesis
MGVREVKALYAKKVVKQLDDLLLELGADEKRAKALKREIIEYENELPGAVHLYIRSLERMLEKMRRRLIELQGSWEGVLPKPERPLLAHWQAPLDGEANEDR